MGKIHNIKPKTVVPEQEVMVLHQEIQPQNLVKANRILLMASLVLMALVLVLSSFLLSSNDLVTELKEKQALETRSALKNSVVNEEVELLKGQLIGVISGSIESKLKSLEKNIQHGKSLTALETINSLKTDLKALRNYANPPVALEKPADNPVNIAVIREMSQLKRLIYLTLGSCGLMFAALAGVWFKGRKNLISQLPKYLERKK
jgi:hypothetical protein